MPWSLPWAYPEFARQEFNRAARMLVPLDRKSTRLNSSHLVISYAVFCLKKKKPPDEPRRNLYVTSRCGRAERSRSAIGSSIQVREYRTNLLVSISRCFSVTLAQESSIAG